MRKWLCITTLLLMVLISTSCVAFHHVGRKGVDWGAIEDTNLIANGKTTKEEVERHFGEPDSVRFTGEDEIWVYGFERSFYIIVYGASEYKDLIIRFNAATGVVKEYKYLKNGESSGIFIPPGSAQ